MPDDLPENPLPELREKAKIDKLALEQRPRRNALIRRAVERGYTQGELALATGLHQTTIAEIVKGRP